MESRFFSQKDVRTKTDSFAKKERTRRCVRPQNKKKTKKQIVPLLSKMRALFLYSPGAGACI